MYVEVSSIYQTILSAPEFNWINHVMWVAGLHRRSGISPRLEDNFFNFTIPIIWAYLRRVNVSNTLSFRAIPRLSVLFHNFCSIYALFREC